MTRSAGRWPGNQIKRQDEDWYLNDDRRLFSVNWNDLSWRVCQDIDPGFPTGTALATKWFGAPRRLFYEQIRHRWSIVLEPLEAKALDLVVTNPPYVTRSDLYRTLVRDPSSAMRGMSAVQIVYETVGNVLQMGFIKMERR